jgi:hypothetical protein
MSEFSGPCSRCGEWVQVPVSIFFNVEAETPEATARDIVEGRVGARIVGEGRLCDACLKKWLAELKETIKNKPVRIELPGEHGVRRPDQPPSAGELEEWAGL